MEKMIDQKIGFDESVKENQRLRDALQKIKVHAKQASLNMEWGTAQADLESITQQAKSALEEG